MSDPTPSLDEFLAGYDQNDNEWWYLVGGDHLNLFDEALERMRAAEAKVARVEALAASWEARAVWHPAGRALKTYAARLRAELNEGEDDEEFCPVCFAGTESSQHLTDPRCGAR